MNTEYRSYSCTVACPPPRAVHPSVARVIGASSIGATPSREHTKPRIVGAAVPAAQEPAPHVPAPRNFGARGARKARTSSQPPPPVGARRASSLPPDYASEQPSIAGLAGTPIYDELAQQERTRRALSVALYAAQSEGRRLAALARSPRAEKPTRPPPVDDDAPDSPALADLLRVADGWAGATAARRSTSVPPCVEIKFHGAPPSTRHCPCDCFCSMACVADEGLSQLCSG